MTSVQIVWLAIGAVAIVAAMIGAWFGLREVKRARRRELITHRAELDRWYRDSYKEEK